MERGQHHPCLLDYKVQMQDRPSGAHSPESGTQWLGKIQVHSYAQQRLQTSISEAWDVELQARGHLEALGPSRPSERLQVSTSPGNFL